MKLQKIFSLLLFFIPFLLFAEDNWYEYIPQDSMLIVRVDFDRLYKSKVYKAVAESGDISDIRSNLVQHQWRKDGKLPEAHIVYSRKAPDTFAILLQPEYTATEMHAALLKKYEKDANTTVTRKTVNKNDLLESLTTFPKRPGKFRKTSIMYVAPHVAAFAAHHQELETSLFKDKYLPATETVFLRENNEERIASGILRSFPGTGLSDPTGLSAYVKNGTFYASETPDGAAACNITLNCKDEQNATLAAKRLQSFTRIMLVAFCAADKSLFKTINNTIKITADGKTAKLEATMTPELLSQIGKYYQDNTTAILLSVGSQL